ncbi:hypothetical protein ACFFRR_009664 [Megaselia abdita]
MVLNIVMSVYRFELLPIIHDSKIEDVSLVKNLSLAKLTSWTSNFSTKIITLHNYQSTKSNILMGFTTSLFIIAIGYFIYKILTSLRRTKNQNFNNTTEQTTQPTPFYSSIPPRPRSKAN